MNKITSHLLSPLQIFTGIFVFLFGVMIFPAGAAAQTANFSWEVIGGADGKALTIAADASESSGDIAVYRWRLSSAGDVISTTITDGPEIEFTAADGVPPGETLDLRLFVYEDENDPGVESGEVANETATSWDGVTLPELTLSYSCNTTLASPTFNFVAETSPKNLSVIPNLPDPEVEFARVGSGDDGYSTITEDSEPPYEITDQPKPYTYQAFAEFSGTLTTLTSNRVNTSDIDCDSTGDEEETANFGYRVNGLTVTVNVLSPLGEYTHGWNFNNEATETGLDPSYKFESGGQKTISLIAEGEEGSGNQTVQTNTTFLISEDSDFADSDGDTRRDDVDEDDDNDGIPDSEDDENDNATDLGGGGDGGGGEEEGGGATEAEDTGGLVVCTNNCGWEQFVQQLNRIVTWLIGFSTAVATLLFMYAGFIYLTSGGDQGKAEQAKAIFGNVAVGFGIILVAYLLVTSVVRILTDEGAEFRDENIVPVDLSMHDLPDGHHS